MRRRASTSSTVACAFWVWAASGCNQPVPAEEHVVKPALPGATAVPEPATAVDPAALPKGVDVPVPGDPEAPAQAEAVKVEPAAPTEPPRAPSDAKAAEQAKAEPSKPTKAEPPAKPEPSKPEPSKPEPPKPEPSKPEPATTPPAKSEPAPAPEPPPKQGVKVPSTAHVRVEIPKGMQALLDADTRMQPWADKAMAIVERCYVSKGFGAKATLVGVVTMHPNERPDVDVTSLPPTLAAVVACATGDLMRNKMPLFTGPEGQRHTLKVRFTP